MAMATEYQVVLPHTYTYMINQQLHIFKYVQSYIIILHRHVVVTTVTTIIVSMYVQINVKKKKI